MIAKFDNFKEMAKPNMWLCHPWARYETVATPLPFPYGEFEGKNLLDRMFGRRESSSAALTGKIGVDYINGSGVFTHAENGSWGTFYRTTDYIPAVAGKYTLTYQNNWDRANGYALALVRYKLVDGVYIPQIPSDPRESWESATLNTSGVLNANAAVIDAGYATSVSITCEDGDYLTCSVVVATSQLLSDTRFPHILTLESTPATIPGPAYDPAVYQSYLAAVVAPRVIEQNRLLGVICALPNTKNTGLTFQFNTMSQLDFTYEKDGSDSYKLLANRRYICVDGVGFFAITSCKQSSSSDGYTVKSVAAVSCEKELENRQIPFIPDGTYTLNELLTGKAQIPSSGDDAGSVFPGFDGLAKTSAMGAWEFVTDITDHIIIPGDVGQMSRTFEDVDTQSNVLTFLLDKVQDAYGCVFDFDYNLRKITIQSRDSYLTESGVQLTQDDFIDQIEIDESADSLYTAVHVIGNDDVTIAPVNPLNSNIIYNFGYYHDWFSTELQSKMDEWNTALSCTDADSPTVKYRGFMKTYYTKLQEISTKRLELEQKTQACDLYTRCRGNVIAVTSGATDSDAAATAKAEEYTASLEEVNEPPISQDSLQSILEEIDSRISAAATTISNLNTQIQTLQSAATAARRDAEGISYAYDLSTYFGDLYQELEPYISEAAYQDEFTVITDSMTHDERWQQMLELFDRATAQLNRVSQPDQQFNVSLDRMVYDADLGAPVHDLTVGRSVWIQLPDGDTVELFLTEIALDLDDKNVGFKFGNKVKRDDIQSVFDDTFNKIQKTANTVQYLKETVTPMPNVLTNIERFMAKSRDLAKEDALSSLNQEVILDDSGYTGRRLKPDQSGEYEDEWLKITNNRIIFLQNDEAKTAVGKFKAPDGRDVYGINAEYVYGRLLNGEQLRLNVMFEGNEVDIASAIAAMNGKTQWLAFDPLIGLTIGASSSAESVDLSDAVITNIANARFSFRYKDTEIAWIDAKTNSLYISSVRVSDRLTIGSHKNGYFDWITTEAGLGLKWRAAGSQDVDAYTTITGTVTITQSGSTLSVTITNVRPQGAQEHLLYRWYMVGETMPVGTGATYTLEAPDVGKMLKVVVYGNTDDGYWGSVASDNYTVLAWNGGES